MIHKEAWYKESLEEQDRRTYKDWRKNPRDPRLMLDLARLILRKGVSFLEPGELWVLWAEFSLYVAKGNPPEAVTEATWLLTREVGMIHDTLLRDSTIHKVPEGLARKVFERLVAEVNHTTYHPNLEELPWDLWALSRRLGELPRIPYHLVRLAPTGELFDVTIYPSLTQEALEELEGSPSPGIRVIEENIRQAPNYLMHYYPEVSEWSAEQSDTLIGLTYSGHLYRFHFKLEDPYDNSKNYPIVLRWFLEYLVEEDNL